MRLCARACVVFAREGRYVRGKERAQEFEKTRTRKQVWVWG